MAKRKKAQQAGPVRLLNKPEWIRAQVEAFAEDIAAQADLRHALICGIRRRGAELARRVCQNVRARTRVEVPYGALDITLYRDDAALRGPKLPGHDGGTSIEGPVDNRVIYLIDDVLCTGRTIRAALDLLMDFGRPSAVRLYSLLDRGGRELPVQPDRVGERLSVSFQDRVEVRLKEVDGEEGVYVVVGGMR